MSYRRHRPSGREKRMTTYVPAEQAARAEQLFAQVKTTRDTGQAHEALAKLLEHVSLADADRPVDKRYLPLRRASQKQAGYIAALARRLGVHVPADEDLWRHLNCGRPSDLIEQFQVMLGERDRPSTHLERQQAAYDAKLARIEQTPILGADKLPFELTESQTRYINKLRASGNQVEITRHTADGDVRIAYIPRRGRYGSWTRKWLYKDAAKGRQARQQERDRLGF